MKPLESAPAGSDAALQHAEHTMSRHNLPSLALLPALLLLPACGLFSGSGNGLADVDDLVTRIERVHVDAELAQQSVRTATDQLEAMVTPGFVGNPVLTHAELSQSVERSIEQTTTLGQSYRAMQDAAEPVFERWNADLARFSSPTLRQRSETRMQQTRSRYEAVVAAAGSAITHCEVVNRSLNDFTLFLGHDFNAAAVADIRDDVRVLAAQARALESELGSCLVAAQTYLEAAELPESPNTIGPPAQPTR